MIIYLAQKYTGMPKKAYEIACFYFHQLVKQGYAVFSPILHTHSFYNDFAKPNNIHMDYVKLDLDVVENFDTNCVMLFHTSCFLLKEDGVIMWDSKGAKKEYRYAKRNGLPCYELEPFLNGRKVKI